MNHAFQLQSRTFSDPQETLNRLPALMNGTSKIIDSVDWYKLRPTDPQFFHAHAHLTDLTSATTGCPPLVDVTGGSSLEPQLSLAKAIGEAVERHCGSFYNPQDIRYASFAELGSDEAVDPRRFVLWSREQYRTQGFPYLQPNEKSIIGWSRGWSLTRNAPVYVPASLVHITYKARTPGELFELAPVSGYACGNTREEAILAGMLEVVERDAFMIFWRNLLPVPGYDLHSFKDGTVKDTLLRYAHTPARLFCSRLTTDIGIPVAFAVMMGNHPTYPAAMIGAAASLDEERAVTRALQELSMVHLLTRTLHESPHAHRPRTAAEVRTQEDHAIYFAARERLPLLDTVLRPRSFVKRENLERLDDAAKSDVKTQIELCVQRLAACELEAIAVDITLPAMAQLGFTVVKVIVPGAQPLDFGMHHPHLNGRRQFDVPVKMGYRPTPPKLAELNFAPHPFP